MKKSKSAKNSFSLNFVTKRAFLTGIKRRWLANSVAPIVFMVILGVAAFSAALAGYYMSTIQSGLEAKAKTSADFLGGFITESYSEYYQYADLYTESFEEKNILELQFINTYGRIVSSSFGLTAGTTPNTGDVASAIATHKISVWAGKDPATGERIMAVSCPILYEGSDIIGIMRYVTSLKIMDRQIILGSLLASAVGLIIILFVIISNLYFIRSIVQPVTEITKTATRIAAGGYGAKIDKHFDDEIGELADTINNMSMQIKLSEKLQSEFISSVSHELRTPLTAISGWGETLIYGGDMDPAETKRGIVIMLKETRRLTKLVEQLLEFTRIQDGRFKLNVEPTDIRAEFEELVYMYASQLKQQGIELDYAEGEEIPEIQGDGERLKQVFLNIFDNAVKHGREGGRITASINREGNEVVVRIRDFGPGIPEQELPWIKMKFYKGSSKASGSGIGLAVCDEIVNLHNGILAIENAEGGGTVVTVRLPIK